jgi:hypothetical protein
MSLAENGNNARLLWERFLFGVAVYSAIFEITAIIEKAT